MKWLIVLGVAVALGAVAWRGFARAAELPAVGQPAPEFSLPDQDGKTRTLQQFRGRWLVLYFYPKADTPGCTEQACKFRDDIVELRKLGAEVVGVSVDDTSAQLAFAKKYSLPFPLLSDSDAQVAARYGSLRDFGVFKLARRNTFLIDPAGNVVRSGKC